MNTLRKCIKLVISKNCTKLHGQQNIYIKKKCHWNFLFFFIILLVTLWSWGWLSL